MADSISFQIFNAARDRLAVRSERLRRIEALLNAHPEIVKQIDGLEEELKPIEFTPVI